MSNVCTKLSNIKKQFYQLVGDTGGESLGGDTGGETLGGDTGGRHLGETLGYTSDTSIDSSLTFSLLSAQLQQYRYGRIFNTLKVNYGKNETFKEAFGEFLFNWVKEESSQLSRQPLPNNIKLEDIETFNYLDLFADLRSSAPIFHSAVSGALATHYSYKEVRLLHRLVKLTHL